MKTLNVAFPNDDFEPIPLDIVKRWNITEPRIIDDTVFFLVGDLLCKMSVEDFNELKFK